MQTNAPSEDDMCGLPEQAKARTSNPVDTARNPQALVFVGFYSRFTFKGD
jgi:hypothetical protein